MTAEEGEERIRQLEAEVRRLKGMLESAPDFITRISVDGKFLYLNRLAPGFRMEQVLGTSIDGYVPPEVRGQVHEAIREARETRSVQQYATVGLVSADRVGHYLTRVSPVIEGGEVTSLVLIATDVTTLEEQRILLQVALDATGLGIWTYNPVTGAASWDETMRRIVGVAANTPAPPQPAFVQQYVHPDDRGRVADALVGAQETGRYGPLEHRIVRPGGEVRWVAASGLAVTNAAGKLVNLAGSIQDITERRVLEARLLEAQKLESIGRLAGGIAHDFNNMLTAILGNVDFAFDAASLDEVRPLLSEVRVTAERSAALTAQLLAFARRQVVAPKVVDPNVLIRRLASLFQRLVGERVRVTSTFAAKGRVRVDESQLEQVIMNLVTNARDAMSEGGSLAVETSDVVIERPLQYPHPQSDHTARESDVTPGSYVVIAVSDTGTGIPPEALPHIFEPFYTTRSGGTGLGLATCHGIVKQSGGYIVVSSEPGRGAKFTVYLPRVDAEPPPERQRPASPAAVSGQRVLLVEDEPSVRAVAERALHAHGYHVRSVASAEEAVRLASQEPAFALLVTDVVLLGMGGRELARQLAQRWPELRVLFISGHTQNAVEQGGELELGISFLQKPFLPIELLLAARKVLEGAETGPL